MQLTDKENIKSTVIQLHNQLANSLNDDFSKLRDILNILEMHVPIETPENLIESVISADKAKTQ